MSVGDSQRIIFNTRKTLSCLLTQYIFDLCLKNIEVPFGRDFDIFIVDGLNLQSNSNFEGFMQDWSLSKISEIIKERGKVRNRVATDLDVCTACDRVLEIIKQKSELIFVDS